MFPALRSDARADGEPDRHRVADRGDGRGGVEDLVVAEPLRARIGALAGVHHRTGGVDQTAGQQHHDHPGTADPPERRQPPHRDPAHRDVQHGVEPARRTEPEHPEQHPEHSRTPDQAEQHDPVGAVQHGHAEGGVRAGDEDEDVGVVQPAQRRGGARAPVEPVVERRAAEQFEGREGVHGHGGPQRHGGCPDQQSDPGQQHHRRHHGVDPAAHPRLHRAVEVDGPGELWSSHQGPFAKVTEP
ncbi:hypothetical protein SDC9_143109 [bioreactor metagenome]|uniref:Uncharacterized protein n=1 Tax=bioreactor metagenome TaxID=1076179 RepID=A0A645E563_9ZZZZ